MAAVVGLIESGRLDVADLISHRFAFENAEVAYSMLEQDEEPYLGIILTYAPSHSRESVLDLPASTDKQPTSGGGESGLIGAGRFARDVLIPSAQQAGFNRWSIISSAGGASAVDVGEAVGFRRAVSDPREVIMDPSTDTVFVATRHDSHASLVVEALNAGKHVFCEKPLVLSDDELQAVMSAYAGSTGVLMVGFNRRWSPAVMTLRELLGPSPQHLQIIYRINAGNLPADHWLRDRRMGGRLQGEGCHFIDTCNAIIASRPTSVNTLTSGTDELLLDSDFTVSVSYANGSQASVVYSASSSTQPGKERMEVLGDGWSAVIDDYRSLLAHGPNETIRQKYRPADKGHRNELAVFADTVQGARDPDEIIGPAWVTSQVVLAAVESAMIGASVSLST
jgi:predicted dehydrogenase